MVAYLRQQHGLAHVSWVNEHGESGRPYDIELIVTSSDGGRATRYIEVKATILPPTHESLSHVRLSLRELQYAEHHPSSYDLYRVFLCGDKPVVLKVSVILNQAAVFSLSHSHSLTFSLTISLSLSHTLSFPASHSASCFYFKLTI